MEVNYYYSQVGLKGKLATSISSSANFYDHTAHEYMYGISSDLGLKYVKGFSPEMRDILTEKGQANLIGFAKDFLWKVSINDSWSTIVRKMSSMQSSTTRVVNDKQQQLYIKLCTRPTQYQKTIFETLNLRPRPYVRKTKVVTRM